MIDIVHYGPVYEEAHCAFATKYWNKRKRITAEYLYWKFRGENGHELKAFILAVDKGNVVGQLGLIPCSIIVDGEFIGAQWACELMVDRDYRGKGIAKLLYEFAYTIKPITLGSDPSPAAAISMKRAGFVGLKGPYKFFFPGVLGEITKLKGFNSKILNKIPNPFLIVFKLWNFFRNQEKFYRINFEDLGKNKNGFSQTDERISVLHDAEFMKWRLNSFKDYYHGIQLYTDGNQSIFSIYRGRDSYLITDYSAAGLAPLLDILSRVAVESRAKEISRIKLMANSRSEFFVLLFLGFLPFRTRTEIIFHCADEQLKQKMLNKYFHYTFMDSDENI
jgi:GNAT superfamily N-acetyltransferase